MKALILLTASLFALAAAPLRAADTKLSGEAVCAKCELHQTKSCQLALKVKGADGKEETILADNNAVAKDFHGNICKKSAQVNAEGTVTEKDGKKTIALSKIEAAK